MKRIISLLLVLSIILAFVPATAMPAAAAEMETDGIIQVGDVYATPGSSVAVDITLKNNPGILGMTLKVTYDESKVTLTSVENGDTLSYMTFTKPKDLSSGCKLPWAAEVVTEDDIADGVIATLTFNVLAGTDVNELIDISVSYENGAIIDNDLNPLALEIVNGSINVIDYTPGDLNEDNLINTTDVVYLMRYIAGGYGITINEAAADVNDDGNLNTTDVVYIMRYIAGGYGIILKPSTPKCVHVMDAVAYKAPTCTENGNISYYHCTICDKYFNNDTGATELALENTVLAMTGHTAVTDPYVAPDYGVAGWTEGSHCSVCNEILVAQKEIPALELNTYAVEYYYTDSDPYLQGLVDSGKLVNSNPATYTEKDNITLKNLAVDGYVFEGWYDGQGAGATQVKTLNKNLGSVQLYAHWSKVTYTVTFDSPDVPIDSVTYTVDTGATLKNPSHFGYTFVGWSKDGKIMSAIPAGTIGNITLHANWTSDRNKAVAVSKYDNPIIIEDMVDGQYLFIYEIGTIQNVPLAEIKNLGNTEGISISESHSYTQRVDESFAKTIAQTVTNATTTTSSWSLSEDWNDTFSATTETGEEVGKTSQTTDSQGNVVEGKYYISNVEGGATTNTSSAGGSNGTSSKVTQGQSAGINGSYTAEHTDSTSTELGGSLSVSAGYQAGPAASRVNVGGEISGHYDKTTSDTDTQSATIAADRSKSFTTEGSSTSESHWDTSNTTSSSWNSTESYESATATSVSSEISNAISESIYNKYGYSSMIERGGENSKTSSTGESMENTNEYSSTVEYSYGEEKNYTETVVRQSSATGYYRLVSAGTVHVFAVVGYDLATNSYYTYTYNILDTERHVYLDYSKDNANFNDCENAILPFEVPYNIHEFISGVIARSDGLRVNETTGVIEAYNGNAEYVVIPEYVAVTDGVAEPYAVRVTGISEDAFADNTTVKGVYLPKYVSEIPESAFDGCTSLEVVMGYGVSKIGAHAFDGCINLSTFTIDNHITSLGEKAFVGVPEINVNAANEAVADAAVKSGATKLTLDITKLSAYDNRVIEISDNTQYFAIIGNGYNGNTPTGFTYKNLRLDSNAEETFVSNMIFEDNKNTPLTFASNKVTLSKVEVKDAPGFAVIMIADNVALDLYGTVALVSASGNAVISKNVTLARSNANVSGVLNLTGNYLVCGDVTNSTLLAFTSGEVKYLSAKEYEAMLTSSILTFNPNGGEAATTEKLIYYGQPYGELPTPTRTGYNFTGWYTAASGGAQVTANTVVTVLANQTLYAHWDAMAYTASWSNGTGYTIAVKRTSSPYAGAATGALSSGATVYYGDVLSITYTASTGYTISSKGSTSITVTGNVTSSNIYATATVNSYTASWNTGTGYSITVKRTSSPKAGASTGTLSSGAKVYYGDVLSVTYTASTGYSISTKGSTSITVTGNVTSSTIYATASTNSYTYNIVYKSSNGTNLGSSTATYKYGTTNTISAPAKSGYNTPSSQSIKWDSTSAKTITFTYTPASVGATTKSGYITNDTYYKLTYNATVEYQNRTATSVQIRVTWTASLSGSGTYNAYGQWFRASVGSASTGNVNVVKQGSWAATSSNTRTGTATSGWITVPLSTTNATSVNLSVYYYQANYNGTDMSGSGTSNLSTTWSIAIPAY